eukprot:COSAG02_NODE_7940_length_2777_cov_2.516804_1_plen_104_part_00
MAIRTTQRSIVPAVPRVRTWACSPVCSPRFRPMHTARAQYANFDDGAAAARVEPYGVQHAIYHRSLPAWLPRTFLAHEVPRTPNELTVHVLNLFGYTRRFGGG